jgi:predicted flavoprotein YhiN
MTYPALTPLTGQHPHGEQLAGVSLYDVQMKCVVEPPPPAPDGGGLEQGAAEGAGAGTPTKKKKKKKKTVEAQRSGFLFTHRGYSGPSVLDLSHHAILALEGGAPKPRVVVDWTGEVRRVSFRLTTQNVFV